MPRLFTGFPLGRLRGEGKSFSCSPGLLLVPHYTGRSPLESFETGTTAPLQITALDACPISHPDDR